jgi:hypothetical protein
MLTESEARDLIDHQVEAIKRGWGEVCERARMTPSSVRSSGDGSS